MSEVKYLNYNILLMRVCGTFKIKTDSLVKRNLFRLWRIAINLATFYLIIATFIDLKMKGYSEFKLVVINYMYIGFGFCAMVRINYFYLFDDVSEDIVNEMRELFKYKIKTGLVDKDLGGHVSFANKFTCMWMVVGTVTVQSIILLPLALNKSAERVLPLPLWFPYDWKVSPYYELTLFYQMFIQQMMGTATIGIDTLFSCGLLLTSAQFMLLGSELKHLLYGELLKSGSANSQILSTLSYVDEVSDCEKFRTGLSEGLNNHVKFHQSLLKFCVRLDEFFSPICLPYFLIVAGLTVLITYIVTSIDDLVLIITCITFTLCGIGTMFWPCLFGHLLTTQTEEFLQDLYDSPWYLCDETFKTKFKILHRRACTPVLMSVGKFGYLSLNLFLTVVRATISYLTVLRQITS